MSEYKEALFWLNEVRGTSTSKKDGKKYAWVKLCGTLPDGTKVQGFRQYLKDKDGNERRSYPMELDTYSMKKSMESEVRADMQDRDDTPPIDEDNLPF